MFLWVDFSKIVSQNSTIKSCCIFMGRFITQDQVVKCEVAICSVHLEPKDTPVISALQPFAKKNCASVQKKELHMSTFPKVVLDL